MLTRENIGRHLLEAAEKVILVLPRVARMMVHVSYCATTSL